MYSSTKYKNTIARLKRKINLFNNKFHRTRIQGTNARELRTYITSMSYTHTLHDGRMYDRDRLTKLSEKYKKTLEDSTHRYPEVDSNQSILKNTDITNQNQNQELEQGGMKTK